MILADTMTKQFQNKKNRSAGYLFLIGIFLLSGCTQPTERLIKFSGNTMGTTYNISYTPFTSGASPKEEVKKEVDLILEKVNNQMSTYRKESELSKLNQNKSTDEILLSSELFSILKLANKISIQTLGAFDVTVGPIVNLWGFGPDGKRKVPSEGVLKNLSHSIGFQKIKYFENRMIKKTQKNLYIDLSAIAKGHGVDQVSNYLDSIQANSYLVEIGGEVRVKGKINGRAWNLGIETPDENSRSIKKIIPLQDKMSMATSGNYRNFFRSKGIRYGHTIDPKTLRPVTHKTGSVTVLYSGSCAKADAFATALMVMNPDEALKFSNDNKLLSYILFIDKNGKIKEKKSTLFTKYLQSK